MNDELEEKLQREKKEVLISRIKYNGKEYIKTIKNVKNGIEYIYYLVDNNHIEQVKDEALISYFKENYENKASNIVY